MSSAGFSHTFSLTLSPGLVVTEVLVLGLSIPLAITIAIQSAGFTHTISFVFFEFPPLESRMNVKQTFCRVSHRDGEVAQMQSRVTPPPICFL